MPIQRIFTFASIVLFLLGESLAFSSTLIVGENGFSTIQSAIDTAVEGDEIIVEPGVYVENLELNGKNLVLRSTDLLDRGTCPFNLYHGK